MKGLHSVLHKSPSRLREGPGVGEASQSTAPTQVHPAATKPCCASPSLAPLPQAGWEA